MKPWFTKSVPLNTGAHIAVIGGGISGITTAYHLKESGYKVTLLEKNNDLMSGASGNPAAILYPYISSEISTKKDFYINAYLYAINFYKDFKKNVFKECPLIKIPQNNMDNKRFRKILESYPSDIVYMENNRLIFPKGGYIIPTKIIPALTTGLNITVNCDITHFSYTPDNMWQLYNNNTSILTADAIVICNSIDILKYTQTSHLNIEQKSGQISYLKPEYTNHSILSSEGYLTPPIETEMGIANLCGSTFEKNNSLEITLNAHKKNILKCPIPINQKDILGGRRAIRAMTPDHMPIVGPVADYDYFQAEYADIHHGSRHKKFPPALYHPHLYINAGLGARGFLTAPYLAKLLCADINPAIVSIDQKTREMLHPARFIIRKLSKKISAK